MSTNTLDEVRILAEPTTYNTRKLLLWQPVANGWDFCGLRDVARERGLEDESVAVQVAAFVDDMLLDGSIRDRSGDGATTTG